MITDVMAFLLIVGAVVSASTLVAEEGARRAGLATRWLWLAAMAAPWTLLIAPTLLPARAAGAFDRALGAVPMIRLDGLVVGGSVSTSVDPLDLFLGASWLLASVAFALVLARTQRTLARERSGWDVTEIAGRRIYVSVDRGPAVAGLPRPWIVLPRWALSLPEDELGLVLLHEEEHVGARDSLLLAVGLALVCVAPWNPIAWWQLRRLRTAMEVDCDGRVLRRAPDARRYGRSLLSVAARASGPSLGLAAFTEKSLSLETRIIAMTRTRSRWTRASAWLFAGVAVAVAAQACAVDSPMTTDAPPDAVSPDAPVLDVPSARVDLVDAELRGYPQFTPFTVAPSITNREEVVAAMEASYPPLLRDAGVGGTVRVYFFINELGRVEDTRIDQSSGHLALDDAALRVASVYRFSPALNKDQQVPVWVSFPITFQATGGGTPEPRR